MAKQKLSTKSVVDAPEANQPTSRERPPLGGQWAQARKGPALLRDMLTQGIVDGRISVEIDPEQIVDEVGPDRISGEDESEFRHLVENIAARGQTQPIRVRPIRADWRPDPSNPLVMPGGAQFALQSGRRRLRACRELGRSALAIIQFDIPDEKVKVADLEERFFENTARKSLSVFEEMLAIGLIADLHPEENQVALATRLGRPQAYISMGRDCRRLYEDIVKYVGDPNVLTLTELKQLLPQIKRGHGAQADDEPTASSKPRQNAVKSPPVNLKGGGSFSIKRRSKGLTLAVDGINISAEIEQQFAEDLKQLLERYEKKESR